MSTCSRFAKCSSGAATAAATSAATATTAATTTEPPDPAATDHQWNTIQVDSCGTTVSTSSEPLF